VRDAYYLCPHDLPPRPALQPAVPRQQTCCCSSPLSSSSSSLIADHVSVLLPVPLIVNHSERFRL
jgi:hypothetical protein